MLEELPPETLLKIYSYLSLEDLVALVCTSKQMRKLLYTHPGPWIAALNRASKFKQRQALLGHTTETPLPTNHLLTLILETNLKRLRFTLADYQKTTAQPFPQGHTARVRATIMLDADTLATASDDSTIKIWNIATGKLVKTLATEGPEIYRLVALPNGQLACGTPARNRDYTTPQSISIWDIESGQRVINLYFTQHTENSSSVQGVAVLPNGWLAGTTDASNSINIWNIRTGALEKRIGNLQSSAVSLTYLPNGRLAAGNVDGTISIWDTQSAKRLQTLSGHQKAVYVLTNLPNGFLASAGGDKTIKIWDTDSGLCVKTLNGYINPVLLLAPLCDGTLVGADYYNTIKVWDTQSGRCLHSITTEKYCNSLCATENGFIVGFADGGLTQYTFPSLDIRSIPNGVVRAPERMSVG